MKAMRWLYACIALLLLLGTIPTVSAQDVIDSQVQQVITQLEAIDTLQQIQDNRNSYKATTGHYDVTTTRTDVIADHEGKRADYETYVNGMFAARLAAKQAYDALSDSQKQLIDPALVAKLDDTLSTRFNAGTFSVTPSDDEYCFEAVNGGLGYAYEVGNYMVAGQIPQTFILVDTSDGKTSWTPNGLYQVGQSNYEVLYCCDIETGLAHGTDYKRVNLEDSSYITETAAKYIRGILPNCYPYVSVEQMKDWLKASGLRADFVDSLTRSDMISAVQAVIWTYSNKSNTEVCSYFASVDVKRNTGVYFTPLHDHTNEIWEWLPQKRVRSYDARAEYRVNMLTYFLCQMEPESANEKTIIASDLQISRAMVTPKEDGSYQVGAYINLNSGGSIEDDLWCTMTSYQENDDGTRTVVDKVQHAVRGESRFALSVNALSGNKIEVTLTGSMEVDRAIYLYEPRGGRTVSQCLVGIGAGKTKVYDIETFKFKEEIGEMGLRIYKTDKNKGTPISDIAFNIYSVDPGDKVFESAMPTKEEVELYATEANKVATLVTDNTGYAAVSLEPGMYLIEEEPNPKVKAPVNPFYVWIPMLVNGENEDGTTRVETINIVSVYPKNEPPEVPPPPPPPPPPARVVGQFEIIKHDAKDSSIRLKDASFAVYTVAEEGDNDIQTITCNGIQYSVVPVMVDGVPLVLETGEDGSVISPELECNTYFLVETKAPKGYIKQEDAISVTVIANTVQELTYVEIPNVRGYHMPETGGIGTTVFTVGGITLMAVAFVLLAWKKWWVSTLNR